MSETAELKRAGLKVTIPRMRVLEILEDRREEHLSAEDVYRLLIEAGDEVSLATVYRVLTQFENAGLVKRQNFEGGHAVFELDSGDHHDHIVCMQCGRVVEFLDTTIEKRQRRIAEAHGFEIGDHTLTIYGKCKRQKCPDRPRLKDG